MIAKADKKVLTCILVLCFTCFSATTASSQGAGGTAQSVQLDQRLIRVDELGAEYSTESNTILVKARIKNTSKSVLRGFATINLLSKDGAEIYSFTEEVNGGNVFDHGETVNFKASAQLADISKVNAISVDFTRD